MDGYTLARIARGHLQRLADTPELARRGLRCTPIRLLIRTSEGAIKMEATIAQAGGLFSPVYRGGFSETLLVGQHPGQPVVVEAPTACWKAAKLPVPEGSGWLRMVSAPTYQSGAELLAALVGGAEGTASKNPYEPPKRPASELTEDSLELQRERHRQFRRDAKRRGRHAEEEKAIKELRDRGAVFFVSHSGGKDSQATMAVVRKLVPDKQIVVVHAPLRHVEWEGTAQRAKQETPRGRPFLLADKYDEHGDEVWLLERVVSKRKWPDKKNRWCTGEWKTGPIKREIRRWADENDVTLIVEAMGMRAQESDKRAFQAPLEPLEDEHGKYSQVIRGKLRSQGYSPDDATELATREWYVWLPIKWQSTDEVFDTIKKAGKKPMWTYQQGMTRASCAFCILASKEDLRVAARLAPELYALYVAVERYIGHTIATKTVKGRVKPLYIEERTGLLADPDLVADYLAKMRKTGDLRLIQLAHQVPKLPEKRLRQLRVIQEQEGSFGQMELPIPVGVWA